MLKVGPAQRVIIHLNDDIGSRDDYLHNQILTLLYEREVAGATVIQPHAGFGLHHRLHTRGAPKPEGEHLPVRIEFVEDRQKVEVLLPELFELLTDGMIEIQETNVVRVAGKLFAHRSQSGPNG